MAFQLERLADQLARIEADLDTVRRQEDQEFVLSDPPF
jgi:hypothetical protein